MGIDVDVIRGAGFGLSEELARGTCPWHAHRHAQVLFAERGAMWLEAAGARWFLPPERAAFLQPEVVHRTTTPKKASLRTVYLRRRRAFAGLGPITVVSVPPVLRESLRYAMRWTPARSPRDPIADRLFLTLGDLVLESARRPHEAELPAPTSTELQRACRFIEAHPGDCGQAAVAKAAGVSVRTLARRFTEELEIDFRSYARRVRMIEAFSKLSQGERATDVALHLGYDSLGAFSSAFTRHWGERPSDVQRARDRR